MTIENLKKVSDTVFQETSATTSRPLEWRRDFNLVSFNLKSPRFVTYCEVTDTDWSADEKSHKYPWEKLRTATKITRAVIAGIDEDTQKDHLYSLKKTDDEQIFEVERAAGPMEIRLKDGEPIADDDKGRNCLYWGSLLRMETRPGEDYLCLEARVPKEQLDALIETLGIGAEIQIAVNAYVLTFTYEVDDALRDWYHSQNLILASGWSPAFIRGISFGQPPLTTIAPPADGEEIALEEAKPPQPPPQLAIVSAIDFTPITKATSKIAVAIWAAIIAAILIAILK